jgi:hypothetical protein
MKVRPHKAAKSGVAWNGTANNPITDNVFIEMRVNKNK